MVGVYQVLTAADIPAGGQKNLNGPSFSVDTNEPEKALASDEVNYYGQPIAIVLADTQEIADQAAAMVKVTYANIRAPIIDVDDAIQKQSIIPNPGIKDLVVGDADQAIAMSSHVTSGTFYVGNQYHFILKRSLAIPTDDGLEIIATTQWTEPIQHVVAQICGAPKNKVNVTVKRIGGGFGGKVDRNKVVSAACGLAAYLTNRPVRMRLPLWDNMEMLGKRYNYKADYQVGHDDTGKLNGVIVTYYREVGYLKNPGGGDYLYGYLDNGSLPAIFFMEQMMEHIARTLNKDAATIKALNFYKQGQVTPVGMTLHHCNLDAVMNELMTSAQVSLRQTTLEYFNTNNRWKKKGLSVVPMKWGVNRSYTKYSVLVNIESDGTVLVHHGGIEMGQGINTKVAQVCAYELGLPVANVFASGSNTVMEVNNANSGGSVTSESCCQGVITCCANLKQRMAPIKAKLVNPTWIDLVNKCLSERIVLSEKVVNVDPDTYPLSVYNSYGAACSEVELDVLTGEYQVNRVDIVYDCGESMNPAIDVGQVEGGFIMGMGYSTGEDIKYDKTTGRLLTNDTWTYHPPTSKDIPIDFRISLLKNAPNPLGVLRSKACGEPPLDMSCSVFFALKKCIEEARKETGDTSYFSFNAPATVEKVQLACNVNTAQFRIQ